MPSGLAEEKRTLNTSTPSDIRPVPSHLIMGIRFHTLPMEDVMALFERVIADRRPTQVSFANAQTVAMCWRDKTLREVINRSDYTFADGMSIVWGGRMLGLPIRHRIAGPDATNELCARAARAGHRVFLLGTSDENLAHLKARLEAAHPGLRVVGTFSPPMAVRFSPEQTEAMIEAINATAADILFVGLSFPKQERWIGENLSRLNVPLCLGVGAAFDFLSGKVKRAPEVLQTNGLEWLYRLWCEPRRLWRRYLWGNLIFLGLLAAERVRRRLSSRA